MNLFSPSFDSRLHHCRYCVIGRHGNLFFEPVGTSFLLLCSIKRDVTDAATIRSGLLFLFLLLLVLSSAPTPSSTTATAGGRASTSATALWAALTQSRKGV